MHATNHVLKFFARILALSSMMAAPANAADALKFFNHYFVTGDYAVGGVGLRGLGDATGFASGIINIPDANPGPELNPPVPDGADIKAAFLYWQTVEKTKSALAGQNGFFNGHAIIGTVLGNPNAPVSWSAGGCSGNSGGTTTLRTYRADVRPFLNTDPSTGAALGNGSYPVRLADSGSNGGGTPLALGATLVLVFQSPSPAAPLNAVVIYDGAFAPSTSSSSMTQTLQGFYDATRTPAAATAKLTQIVGNGQPNKLQVVSLNNQSLPSLYPGLPPFPGFYNGSWDNPTWFPNQFGKAVNADDASAITQVVPNKTNSGCVSWGALVMSTVVQDSDNDGLLDIWETNQGYVDIATGQTVNLPGANPAQQDLFIQVDYMASHDNITSSGALGHFHKLKRGAIDIVGDMLKAHGINLHVDCNNCYPGDPYVIPSATGGNVIDESDPHVTCNDNPAASPPLYCQFPGVPVTSWKGGFTILKNQPLNYSTEAQCQANIDCIRRFQHGRNISYHYVLFGHALGLATTLWRITDGSLVSIVVDNASKATVTTASPHGLASGSRVTVSGAISSAPVFGAAFTLNGTYAPITVTSPTTFTFVVTNVPPGTFNNPTLFVSFGLARSISGWSDYKGADTFVSFGLWPSDVPGDHLVGSVNGQAGTLGHELGHTFGLRHGGGDPTNCKANYQSLMNYHFQIRLIPGFDNLPHADFSNQQLPNLNEGFLNEADGIGAAATQYRTRWFAPFNFIDQLLNAFGGRAAARHCDGTAITDGAQMVRVEGPLVPGAIDWNNNGSATDSGFAQDLNFNNTNFNSPPGMNVDPPFTGFNDWAHIDLRQIGARRGVFAFSADNWGTDNDGSGGTNGFGGNGTDGSGGTDNDGSGGTDNDGSGGTDNDGSGGLESDFDQANTTVDAPLNLTAANVSKTIVLNWAPPAFGQIRKYLIWRANITKVPMSPTNPPVNIGSVSTPIPPATTFTDPNVTNKATYLYFVTAQLGADSGPNAGNQSGPSSMVTIMANF
jgi:hypothetical protein